jgi:hypothetical protein
MATGDHFETIDWQYIQGKDCFNVFHWLQTSGSGGAAELNSAFKDYILPPVIAVQSADVTHLSLLSTNYDDFADYNFVALTADNVGQEGGTSLPAFNGWTFRMVRSERGHHHGRKNFTGIASGDQEDGSAVSGLASGLVAVATALAGPIFYGGNYWSPQIMRAPNTIKPDYNNARAFYSVGSAAYVGISTQSSRKH